MKELVIGVDVGYGYVKGSTLDVVFPSGVRPFAICPPDKSSVVKFNNKYYVTGVPQMDIKRTKYQDESNLIVTLAAIARTLHNSGRSNAHIRLGVGLPLTRLSAEQKQYKSYLPTEQWIRFEYEDKKYSVFIDSVDVFPQGYAAVVNKLREYSNSTVVIDVGSWTVDILPIINKKPDLARCKSLNMGIITCMNEINEELRQRFDGEAEESIFREVMRTGKCTINPQYYDVIRAGLERYVENIFNQLRTLKFNDDLLRFVFVGGGSSVIRNFGNNNQYEYIEDININAKGYEDLVRHKYKTGDQ